MHIILAAATYTEIGVTVEWLKNSGLAGVEVLLTGIGSTATSWSLTRSIQQQRPSLVIQAGIAGTFSSNLQPGQMAFVNEECFADLGAIEDNCLNDIFDLGLAAVDEKPFRSRLLINPDTHRWAGYGLPFVRGATVNSISSTPGAVERIINKYHPSLESMEGAVLHYVCLQEAIPFIQLRSISNIAGERNKENWQLKTSVQQLNMQLKRIITDLTQENNK